MSSKKIISIVSIVIFAIIAIYIIFYPSYYSNKESINGEVILVWKPNSPRASWLIELHDQKRKRIISYPFPNDIISIFEGDSLRKSKNSTEIYLKRKNTFDWIVLDNASIVD